MRKLRVEIAGSSFPLASPCAFINFNETLDVVIHQDLELSGKLTFESDVV